MKQADDRVFLELFKEVCRECFGHWPQSPLSDSESSLLSNAIFERTGLTIGAKSIRNYSLYVASPSEGKKENPSIATLDTLARYVLHAPETDELTRKKKESHYPYWFRYRKQMPGGSSGFSGRVNWKPWLWGLGILVLAVILVKVWPASKANGRGPAFTEEFKSVEREALDEHGWIVQNKWPPTWRKRDSVPGYLCMYTLIGDNWPPADGSASRGTRNLLVHAIEPACFSAEVHLSDFIPFQNWQQAGLLLSEDSAFNGKTIRFSLGYNDFFGGYTKDPEILLQAVGSMSSAEQSRPEELAHLPLFTGNPRSDTLIRRNLARAALKIEKKGDQFRFLYSVGPMEGFAYKEATQVRLDIHPRYVALFAMQGMASQESAIPVLFDSFSLVSLDCDQ